MAGASLKAAGGFCAGRRPKLRSRGRRERVAGVRRMASPAVEGRADEWSQMRGKRVKHQLGPFPQALEGTVVTRGSPAAATACPEGTGLVSDKSDKSD